MFDGSFGLAALDDNVAQWRVGNADSVTVDILKVITYFGDTAVLLVALIATWLIDYCRHRRTEVIAFLATVIVGEKPPRAC